MVRDEESALKCQYCHTIFTSQEQQTLHERECQQCPAQCPKSCGSGNLTRKDINDHMENCPKNDVQQKHHCPFRKFGCPFTGHDQSSLVNHVTGDNATLYAHMAMMCDRGAAPTLDQSFLRRLDNVEADLDRLSYIYGPHYVWRIDDFRRRFNDAKAGAKVTTYSPAFLTGRCGYKMAVSACLYGDGRVRGKSMSLFVCLCRGDYDALQQWPFQHRVTFTLLDQNRRSRRHLSYTLKPNLQKETMAFLSRPSTERNASFGAQAFCDVEKIVESLTKDDNGVAERATEAPAYVLDDVMFVKVEVDTGVMARV